MKQLYLDTNFFIYLSDPLSSFYNDCVDLLSYCKKYSIRISTSTETIQEIIHYSKNIKQLDGGLITAKTTLQTINELIPITPEIIKVYLEKVQTYPNRKSRDILHLSACIENKIDCLVTLDNDFKKFNEVKILRPDEALTQI